MILFRAVSNTGAGNRVIDSTDAINWQSDSSANDYLWSGMCWSKDDNTFVAVSKSGYGNRVMTYTVPDPYSDIAPDGWTLVSTGQTRYSTTETTDYIYEIIGDGVTADRGSISQSIETIEVGEIYILSAIGCALGVTQGKMLIEVIADGAIIAQLVWMGDDTDWTQRSTYMIFDTTPNSVILRVHAVETLNYGGYYFANTVIFENYADFDISANGSSIITRGTLESIPDVKITSNSMTTASTSTGKQVVKNYGEDDVLGTTKKIFVVEYTETLPSLGSGKQYRLDEVFSNLGTMHAGTTAYMSVTVQSSGTSLYNGAETRVALWTENTRIPPNYNSFKKDLALLADENESIIIRYYMKTSNSSYQAMADSFGYKYAVVTTTVVSGAVSIINTTDPLTVMPLCNNLYPGCSLRYNNDMTGAFEYSEDYRDDTWRTVCQSWTGDVTYSQTDKKITIADGASMLYLFDTYAPITGIPYITVKIKTGIPQFAISVDGSNWYNIDGNTSFDHTDTKITRQLDSNNYSFHLKGNTFFYLNVSTLSGRSCVLGATFLHADLNTMDIPRIKLYPTGLPQSIEAFLDAPTNAIISLYSRDVQPVV